VDVTFGQNKPDRIAQGVGERMDFACQTAPGAPDGLVLASAIPSFFRGPKCNSRLAFRGDDSRMTSPEARPRGSELLRQRSRMLDVGP
jgi:hypothetical protein